MPAISNKKGFALIVTMYMIIILFISIGVHSRSTLVYKEVQQDEVIYSRGYYAGISALRYAAILLKNPDDIVFNGNVYTITGNELAGSSSDANGKLFTQLGVKKFPVKITRITTGDDAGKYELSAEFPVK